MLGLILELLSMLLKVFVDIFMSIIFTVIPAPQKSVNGEIILITGAGSGIGQLMAIDFASRGATIVAWDINKEGNQQTADKVKARGGKIYTYICDVSNKSEVYRVADQVKQDVGDVTILINNAGIVSGKKFLECPDEKLVSTMQINVLAHFWTLKCFLPAMVRHNHGHVVTIASMAGIMGVNGLADYCASKFANVGFTESLSLELLEDGRDGVHTTTICPYQITTGMFQGCASRFPALIPAMSPEYAAGRIVRAVLTNQRILYMPRVMYQLGVLRSLLPSSASVHLNQFFGGLNFMSAFVGRQKKE